LGITLLAPGSDIIAALEIFEARLPQEVQRLHERTPALHLPPGNALVEEALAQAVETEVEDVRTRVMTAEHLTAIALQTGRAKDFARILQFIESGTLDADKLDAILQQYGLIAKWEEFGDKFKGNL